MVERNRVNLPPGISRAGSSPGIGTAGSSMSQGLSGQTAWELLCAVHDQITALTVTGAETKSGIDRLVASTEQMGALLAKLGEAQEVSNRMLEVAVQAMTDTAMLLSELATDLRAGMLRVETTATRAAVAVEADTSARTS